MCTRSSAKFISKKLKLFVCDRQNGYCNQQDTETNGVKSHSTTMVISARALIKVKEDVCTLPLYLHHTQIITQDLKLDIRSSTKHRQGVMRILTEAAFCMVGV